MQETAINEKKKRIVPPIQLEGSRSDALHNNSISTSGEKVNAKFSLKTDSAYMATAMRGDTKTAQEMLDEAAKAAERDHHETPSVLPQDRWGFHVLF